jgi:ankyrin repeat protein
MPRRNVSLNLTVLVSLALSCFYSGASAATSRPNRNVNHQLIRAIDKKDGVRALTLLARGANPNVRDSDGWPALTLACAKGEEAVARASVLRGANMSSRTGDGRTPLNVAAGCRRPSLVTFLLKHGALPGLNEKNDWGYTALMEAHDLPTVRLLIQAGADVNAVSKDKETALTNAAELAEPELAQYLIEHGADARRGDTSFALGMALLRHSIRSVELLVDHGANVNVHDSIQGDTPLHSAALDPDAKYVLYLLDHGADPNVRNEDGKTPLMYAAQCGHVAAMQMLIGHGALIDARDSEGKTALMQAAWEGKVNAVHLLLARGADPEAKDNDGKTARTASHETRDFQIAVDSGFTALLSQLATPSQARHFRRVQAKTIQKFQADDRKRQAAHMQVVKMLLRER